MNFVIGALLIVAAVGLVCLGIYRRKKAFEEYGGVGENFTEKTLMTVVGLEEASSEQWEDRINGAPGERELVQNLTYRPTYEYTVGGKTYQYRSEHCLSDKNSLGRKVNGYFDPNNPEKITEYKPRKPLFKGALCFLLAAALLVLAFVMIKNALWLLG